MDNDPNTTQAIIYAQNYKIPKGFYKALDRWDREAWLGAINIEAMSIIWNDVYKYTPWPADGSPVLRSM